jgi:hypothetical protein
MSFSLESFKKELAGAGIIGSMIVMDYMHIDDQPLRLALLGLLSAITLNGGYQSYKSSQSTPPQQ